MNRYKPVANSIEEARLEFDSNDGVEPSHQLFQFDSIYQPDEPNHTKEIGGDSEKRRDKERKRDSRDKRFEVTLTSTC